MKLPETCVPERVAPPVFPGREKGCFCVRVSGTGLTKGIFNKGKIILRKQLKPQNGQVVLALVGSTPFLGKYYDRGQFVALRTIDKRHTYFAPTKEVKILGVVKGGLREYE